MSATAAQISGPIVVTSGAGFLGGVVVEQLLARGITDIRVVDLADGKGRKDARGTVRHFTCDLRTDPLNGAFAGAKTVLHLAACQYHTPFARSTYELPFYEINVNATRHVLDAAEKAGDGRGRNELVRFVFVSTSMVYGLPQSLPITEDHPRNPFGPYGQSKLEAERRVEAAHSKKLDCAIVRPGLIVGPGRVGVIGHLFGWIRKNRPIVMIGNADNRYELMHVAEVASLVLAAAEHRGFGVYNCAAASVQTMREWITAVKDKASSRSQIIGVPGAVVKPVLSVLEQVRLAPLRKDQFLIADLEYYMDASLAKKELGWSPKKSGLEAMMDTF